MREPVHIPGAGPSGLAAALTAVEGGRQVVVYERSRDVGHRFHDDFQGLENWTTDGDVLEELASLAIEPTFAHTPFSEAVVFDPTGREHICRSSSRALFYLVRRGADAGTLDSSLKAQAIARGVAIRFGEPRHHLPDGGIVAEGPHGSDAVAVGYVFRTDAADGAYGALSDRLAPEGYAYLLVSGGRGTVACCMFRDFHNEKTYLARTVEFFRERVGFDMRSPRRFGGAGNVAVPRTARRGRLLFAGEAAGFQDALWGFGMRYAMVSGSLAARCVVAGRPEDYDRRWRERLGGLLRTAIVNRCVYGMLGDRGYRALARSLDRAGDARAWARRLYRPSLLKGILFPAARRLLRSSRRERLCAVEECDCTWCRCWHEATGVAVSGAYREG